MVREQACFKLWKPLSLKSIRTWSFERQPFSPKPIRFAASFYSHRGKVYLNVNETFCWKSLFPNHERGSPGDVLSGRHCSISKRDRRSRNGTLPWIRVCGDVH